MLLRSNGLTWACGDNTQGQCAIPALAAGTTYSRNVLGCYNCRVLQAAFEENVVRFVSMDGELVCSLEATPYSRLMDIQADLARQLGPKYRRVAVTLPNGELLANVLSEQPFACLAVALSPGQGRQPILPARRLAVRGIP